MDAGDSSSDGFGDRSSHYTALVRETNVVSNSAEVHTLTLGLDIQSNAMILARQRSAIRLPWEVGFGARMFGPRNPIIPFPKLHVPKLPQVVMDLPTLHNELQVAILPVKRPLVPFVLRTLRSIDIPYDGDALKLRAINRWRIIVELNLEASDVGKQIVAYIEDGKSEILIISVLQDVFATKKASTMNKRASSLIQYLRWAMVPGSKVLSAMRFEEDDCYRFVSFLKATCAAPTAAKSFKESLNFAMHTLGMPQIQATVKSTRIAGSTMGQLSKKRPLKQALAYKVNQLRLMHHILETATDDRDKCMIGYSINNVYCSGRFSDGMYPTKYVLDLDEFGYGFIELYTLDHKVATNAERRSVFLPLISISPGIAKVPWAPLWLAARERTGLSFCKGPTMPAPSSNGGWTDRALSASEGAQWTRELLAAYGPKSLTQNRVTSHSGKVTILSWAAKFGMDKSFRKCLGHHLEQGELSVTTYSRSALDIPLQSVVQMLQQINDGLFDPDSSRLHRQKMARTVLNAVDPYRVLGERSSSSQAEVGKGASGSEEVMFADQDDFGRFEQTEFADEIYEQPVPEENASEPGNSTSSSSDQSESSSDDSVDEDEARIDEKAKSELSPGCAERPMPFLNSLGLVLPVMQHVHNGTLHCRRNDTHLECNRLVSRSFAVVTTLKLQWPICSQCRKKIPVVSSVFPTSKARPPSRV